MHYFADVIGAIIEKQPKFLFEMRATTIFLEKRLLKIRFPTHLSDPFTLSTHVIAVSQTWGTKALILPNLTSSFSISFKRNRNRALFYYSN